MSIILPPTTSRWGPPTEADLLYQHAACKRQDDRGQTNHNMNMRNARSLLPWYAPLTLPRSGTLRLIASRGTCGKMAYIANSKMQIAPPEKDQRVGIGERR